MRQFWHMRVEFCHNGRSPPHEDPTIPEVLVGRHKLCCDLCRRFLDKLERLTSQRGGGDGQGVAHLNVAIARRRIARLHSQRHEHIGVRRCLRRLLQTLTKRGAISNGMICW